MSQQIVDAVGLGDAGRSSILAWLSLWLLRRLDVVQRIIDQQSDRLFLRHGRWHGDRLVVWLLLLDLLLVDLRMRLTAQIVQHCLKLNASDALVVRIDSLSCVLTRSGVAASSRPREPLVRFGGHVWGCVLHFLVNLVTLLVIVDGRDANIIVYSDLLVYLVVVLLLHYHFAVHDVPAICSSLLTLVVLAILLASFCLLRLHLRVWARVRAVFIAI